MVGSLLHLDNFDFQRPAAWLWFLAVLGLIASTALAFGVFEVMAHRRRSVRPAAVAEPAGG